MIIAWSVSWTRADLSMPSIVIEELKRPEATQQKSLVTQR
jgi:hypothetical protein